MLEEEKCEINQLKETKNSIYPRFHHQLPMMHLVYKATCVRI